MLEPKPTKQQKTTKKGGGRGELQEQKENERDMP